MPSPGFLDFGTKCPEVEKAKGILVVPFLRSYNGIVEDNNNFLRRFQAMRFVLKIFAAPFVLALSLAVGVLSFVFSLASWAFRATPRNDMKKPHHLPI